MNDTQSFTFVSGTLETEIIRVADNFQPDLFVIEKSDGTVLMRARTWDEIEIPVAAPITSEAVYHQSMIAEE